MDGNMRNNTHTVCDLKDITFDGRLDNMPEENLNKCDKFHEGNKQGAWIEVLRTSVGRLDGRDYIMRGCWEGCLRW